MSNNQIIKMLPRSNNNFIAYNQIFSKRKDNNIEIIFLCGFNSNMHGTKAQYAAAYCLAHNYQLIRFDYYGHGQSSGNFSDGTIGLWLEDTLSILDNLTSKKQIIIGSSMGGWLAILLAKLRPEKICGLIGIASAPDFTENLIYNNLSPLQKEELSKEGVIQLSSDYCNEEYTISANLIQESRKHLIKEVPINSNYPVYLIHGMEDKDVPYETSIQLSKQFTTNDLHILLKKDGKHNMNEIEDLELLNYALNSLIKKIIAK